MGGKIARDVIDQILAGVDPKLSWQRLFDPATENFRLVIHRLAKAANCFRAGFH
jgi:hypothetical protein